jgi:hypothetical protein
MARQQQWTKEERRGLLWAEEERGQSATAFAEAAGLPRSTLTSWRRRSTRPTAVTARGTRAPG